MHEARLKLLCRQAISLYSNIIPKVFHLSGSTDIPRVLVGNTSELKFSLIPVEVSLVDTVK